MLMLSHDNFIKARDYIFANGEDIDRAWFRYIFEDGDSNAFLNVLAKYQYDDGGFGGLYYEFDYQGPCLKSTEIAVEYILRLDKKPPADHPMIQKVMAYLLDNYLPEIGNWGEVAVPAVNDGVHCHWVRYRGEDTTSIENEDERIRRYDANEKVCFAAFVSYYSEIVPQEVCRDILKYPTEHILRYWDELSPDYDRTIFDKGEPYNFEYFQEFIPFLKNRSLADKLTSILRQNPTAFMELDFKRSNNEYMHLPCDSVSSPDRFIYPVVKELVAESLEYRMIQQGEDGCWHLGWSFGDDAGFQELQIKYEAYRTLQMLVKLKRFGRIEENLINL